MAIRRPWGVAFLFDFSQCEMGFVWQRDPTSGEPEGLSFDFDLCEAVATWEQVSLGFVN